MRRSWGWAAGLAISIVTGCGSAGAGLTVLPGEAQGRVLPLGLPAGFETSGAVWHAVSGRLIVVSDEGVLALVTPDGKERQFVEIGGDLEAVTLADPRSSIAYVGVERPACILEVDLKTGRTGRRFELDDMLDGLEGLAFVPGDGPDGGTFWVGVQDEGRVVEVSLPLGRGGAPRKVRDFVPLPGTRDLSDLGYDAAQNVVLALYDKPDLLVALSPRGALLGQWALPGDQQEAVAVLPAGLAIGDDASGQVVLYPTLSLRGRP
jgi:hypothetical protein